jgi:hypothetical protein
VHGAIGITAEYDLQLFTRRLWTWASDFGSSQYWAGLLGRVLLDGRDEGVGRPAGYGNYLYTLSSSYLTVYNVSNPSSPVFIRQIYINAGLGAGDSLVRDGYLYVRADDD